VTVSGEHAIHDKATIALHTFSEIWVAEVSAHEGDVLRIGLIIQVVFVHYDHFWKLNGVIQSRDEDMTVQIELIVPHRHGLSASVYIITQNGKDALYVEI
jgi:hypothetical protein